MPVYKSHKTGNNYNTANIPYGNLYKLFFKTRERWNKMETGSSGERCSPRSPNPDGRHRTTVTAQIFYCVGATLAVAL